MQTKVGFIYIWHDRKRKMFYIGRHWGTEDDGYICSSNRMRDAYQRRPLDFKRRILQKTNDKRILVEFEQKYLNLIKPTEFGTKYYNLNSSANGYGWWLNENAKLIVTKSISDKLKGISFIEKYGKERSVIIKEKMRASQKLASNKPEVKEKKIQTLKQNFPCGHKGQFKKGVKVWNIGKKDIYSEETKKKMGWSKGKTLSSRTEETKKRISDSQKGKKRTKWLGTKFYNNGIEQKMFQPGEQPLGWNLGRMS